MRYNALPCFFSKELLIRCIKKNFVHEVRGNLINNFNLDFTQWVPDAKLVSIQYSWTLLIQSPKGKGKWFELVGVRIKEVKISSISKALQGK